MTHNYNSAELTTETFENFVFDDGGITETESSNVSYGDIKTSNIISENPVLSDDKPSKPLTFELNARYNGFSVLVGLADEENIKGIYVYMKKSVDINWSKELFSSTNFFIAGSSDNTYEIKLTTFNFSGIESDETEIKFVVPLKPSSDDISYPLGQSPSELEEASNLLKKQLEADILTLQNSDLELEGRIETNASNITQTNENITLEVSSAITSLRDNEISSLQSSIDLNAEGITLESSAREAAITNVNNPTNLLSQINIAPESIKLNSNLIQLGSGLAVEGDNVLVKNLSPEVIDFRDGDVIYKDIDGILQIDADQLNIAVNNLDIAAEKVILTDGSNVGSVVAKYEDGYITLNANTTITGEVETFGSTGIVTYNNSTEASSTKKIVIKGGIIEFWERV
jgi:hypothetical protein